MLSPVLLLFEYFERFIIFIAESFIDWQSLTSFTLPYDPTPRVLMIKYWLIFLMPVSLRHSVKTLVTVAVELRRAVLTHLAEIWSRLIDVLFFGVVVRYPDTFCPRAESCDVKDVIRLIRKGSRCMLAFYSS